ncbi:ATP-binding protein [Microbacterium sp.]|uniref:sensor histidine kinase n=1 Tax=Microbacterium sp. TaxID=51671 RepID=UPI0026013242|nr:ATP-binding protein [Microbacterium sp.]
MTADADRGALDAAWGSIPQSRETTAGLGSFTRTRVERMLAIVIGVGCMALSVQAFLTALGPSEEDPAWHLPLTLMVFLPLAAMIIACFVGRGAGAFAALFAILYIVALILWPFATLESSPTLATQPWIFYLINVATVCTVLAFPLTVQIIWTVVTPLLWGLVRMVQVGFDPAFGIPVSLDVSFALILGGILITLGWMFRSIAANVDETRARAVESYAAAAAADATEQERIAVGALMHDSVLAALIAAERADSPRERTLAVSMAREALTRLANTERDSSMGSEAPTSIGDLATELDHAAAELGAALRVDVARADADLLIPGGVARALVLAATQAISNAIQHADAAGLDVSVASTPEPLTVQVRVRDSGPGFDTSAVPADRLGISASIVARVAAVGGRSRIESDRRGTVVALEWAEPA